MKIGDTIAAVATAPGAAAVAILRISGPASFEISRRIFRGREKIPPRCGPYGLQHGRIIDPADPTERTDVDDVVLLSFKAPHSYTGEDVVEIQCHGGTCVIRRILRIVLDLGARPADPGEFTRRAFLNGKMDLIQAEAVADLITAQTEKAAASAVEQLEGHLSMAIGSLYSDLLTLSSDVENSLDFSENELPDNYYLIAEKKLKNINDQLVTLISTWDEGRILRQGALVVICGRVNAGKSTLLNLMLGIDRAIVSPFPGTTRDTIEEPMAIHGLPCRLIDTAGLRLSDCSIEQEGVIRTKRYVERADLLLYVVDVSQPLTADDRKFISENDSKKMIIVLNKDDLGVTADLSQLPENSLQIFFNSKNPESIKRLKSMIYDKMTKTSTAIHGTHIGERHYKILVAVKNEIDQAIIISSSVSNDLTLIATHIKNAADQVGRIIGKTYFEDVLNEIFSRFCIGK